MCVSRSWLGDLGPRKTVGFVYFGRPGSKQKLWMSLQSIFLSSKHSQEHRSPSITMEKRSTESPMDFEWQTRAHGDVTSPFYQLSVQHDNQKKSMTYSISSEPPSFIAKINPFHSYRNSQYIWISNQTTIPRSPRTEFTALSLLPADEHSAVFPSECNVWKPFLYDAEESQPGFLFRWRECILPRDRRQWGDTGTTDAQRKAQFVVWHVRTLGT